MLIAKIDVMKIDKTKLFPGKNGAKYLDLVFIETPDNQYGDSHMIVQGVSKEEREAGKRGVILGNAKTIGTTAPKPEPDAFKRADPSSAPTGQPAFKKEDDDVNF